MSTNEFKVDQKDPLICPNCHQKIVGAAGVTPGHSGTIRKNQIFICASCGTPSLVGDSNLELINQKKFKELPSNIQAAIQGIISTIHDTNVTQTDLN